MALSLRDYARTMLPAYGTKHAKYAECMPFALARMLQTGGAMHYGMDIGGTPILSSMW